MLLPSRDHPAALTLAPKSWICLPSGESRTIPAPSTQRIRSPEGDHAATRHQGLRIGMGFSPLPTRMTWRGAFVPTTLYAIERPSGDQVGEIPPSPGGVRRAGAPPETGEIQTEAPALSQPVHE